MIFPAPEERGGDAAEPEQEEGPVQLSVEPDEPQPMPTTQGALAFIKDNIEAFAVAIVMALIIKHFCVEAFKIPTGSMRPTLLGKGSSAEGVGDRILVNKVAYLFAEPDRWEIPVFHYPLQRARNFIKRIVGLPGEHLRIHQGDIWIRKRGQEHFAIARKNERVREQLYFRVYPPYAPEADPSDAWRGDLGMSSWVLEATDEFYFVGGEAASLTNVNGIFDSSTPESWKGGHFANMVRDIRVRAHIVPAARSEVPEPMAGLTFAWKPDGVWQAVVELGAKSSVAYVQRGASRVVERSLDVTLRPGKAFDLTMEFVDGDLRVRIDGDEVAVLPDGRTIDDDAPQNNTNYLTVTARNHPVSVRNLVIDRDLFYENDFASNRRWEREGIEIPDENYFVLGDNTKHSSDSRKWSIKTLHLKDGTKIHYDESPRAVPGKSGMRTVVDWEGVTRVWRRSDVDRTKGTTTRPMPFVWRDLIIGRAFLIFWPLTPDPPGRLRFIH